MYLVTHLTVLSFVLVNCFNFINKSDAFECLDKVHASRQLNKQYFVTVRTKNLHDCIDECKARAKCSAINYRESYGLCQLLEAAEYNVSDTILAMGYVYGDKSEWDMDRYGACKGTCAFDEVCNIEKNGSATCEFKECGIPEHKNNTILLGNLYNVGSKICYECSEGFEGKRQCSTCMEDGNWTGVNISCTCLSCPEWQMEQGHYYLIVKELKTWADAEANCKDKGGYLVNLKDKEEDVNVASPENFPTGHSFWIGAKYNLLVKNFTWQDGSPLGYSKWDENEPNQPEACDVQEHCVVRSKDEGHFKWRTSPCDEKFESACEKPR